MPRFWPEPNRRPHQCLVHRRRPGPTRFGRLPRPACEVERRTSTAPACGAPWPWYLRRHLHRIRGTPVCAREQHVRESRRTVLVPQCGRRLSHHDHALAAIRSGRTFAGRHPQTGAEGHAFSQHRPTRRGHLHSLTSAIFVARAGAWCSLKSKLGPRVCEDDHTNTRASAHTKVRGTIPAFWLPSGSLQRRPAQSASASAQPQGSGGEMPATWK